MGPLDDSNMAACLTLSLYNGKGINISEEKLLRVWVLFFEKGEGREDQEHRNGSGHCGREAARERERERERERGRLSVLKIIPEEENPQLINKYEQQNQSNY